MRKTAPGLGLAMFSGATGYSAITSMLDGSVWAGAALLGLCVICASIATISAARAAEDIYKAGELEGWHKGRIAMLQLINQTRRDQGR